MTQLQQIECNAPVLSSLFPLHFRHGYTVTMIEIACRGCGRVISMSDARGRLNMRSSFIADIDAIARCRCGMLNQQRVRLWDDMCFSALNYDGEWEIGRVAITWKNRLRIKAHKFVSRVRERKGMIR